MNNKEMQDIAELTEGQLFIFIYLLLLKKLTK